MIEHSTDILVIGGGAAGMSAALAASESKGLRVTIVDDNPRLGGQIWRAELGKSKSSEADRLISAITSGKFSILNGTQIFGTANDGSLLGVVRDETIKLHYNKLILATGAREHFLPFPGWTSPRVFGAGGLQALVKGGFNVSGKRILVAGTGPLLLVVAEYLKQKGAKVVAIAEQASASKINRFALGLWRYPTKIAQGLELRSSLGGIPYLKDCWVTAAKCKSPRVSKGETSDMRVSPSLTHGLSHGYSKSTKEALSVMLTQKGRSWSIECDYLAVGFHLVPNTELAVVLGCSIGDGFVLVDKLQRTSKHNIFAVGEPTGIGGVEASLIEGRIAGYAAAGETRKAESLFVKRDRTSRFADSLNSTFALRDELKTLADATTTVCRCEDVSYASLCEFSNAREAKLQTRCGMGPCQGRVCGPATEFLFGWQPGSVRQPIFPVKLETL